METKNKKQVTNLQMIEVDHKMIAIEKIDGNVHVNLTQMSKPFGKAKRPDNWLRSSEAKEYIEALSVSQKCGSADLLKVKKGGKIGAQGTWAMDYRVAMRYAQWLSPEFSVAVDEMLVKLMRGDAVMAEPLGGVWPIIQNGVVGYPRKEILEAAGYSSSSGTIHVMRKRHPQEHFQLCRVACLSPRFAKLRYESGKVRQLALEFYSSVRAEKKGGK
jgi:predicted nucleic acid-binding Zn finger protein